MEIQFDDVVHKAISHYDAELPFACLVPPC